MYIEKKVLLLITFQLKNNTKTFKINQTGIIMKKNELTTFVQKFMFFVFTNSCTDYIMMNLTRS